VLDGRLSPIVEVEKGRGIVLRATDHKLPQQKPLDAVRSDVIKPPGKTARRELARAAAADAVKRLTAGESWDSVAKSLGRRYRRQVRGRIDQAVPLEIRRLAFELPKPAGKPQFQSVGVDNGDSAVFAVSAVREDPNAAIRNRISKRREFAQQAAAANRRAIAARRAPTPR
jgi:hypothetical protein